MEYRDGETVLEGILCYDDAISERKKRPGVLVCHTFWGVEAYCERRAKQLAELGYLAFVFDVFGRWTQTDDPALAGDRMRATFADMPSLRRRAAAVLGVLAEHSRVNADRLAVIGYCFGGTVALELARSALPHTENLRAVVAFHAARLAVTGTPEEISALSRNVKGSVLVCHGAADPHVVPGELDTLIEQFESAGTDYVFVAYAAALHAFTDPGSDARNLPAAKCNPNADRRSWDHVKALFAEKMPTELANPNRSRPNADPPLPQHRDLRCVETTGVPPDEPAEVERPPSRTSPTGITATGLLSERWLQCRMPDEPAASV